MLYGIKSSDYCINKQNPCTVITKQNGESEQVTSSYSAVPPASKFQETHTPDSASTLPHGTLRTKFRPQDPNAPFHRLVDWWQNSGNNAFLNVTWNCFDCTNFTLWSLPFQLPHQLPPIKITGFHHSEGHWLLHCWKLLGYISPRRDLNMLLSPLRPSPPLQLEEASLPQN